MISKQKASAVWILHQEGIKASEIAQKLGLDRKTVKKIIDREGVIHAVQRKNKLVFDEDLIIRTFKRSWKS